MIEEPHEEREISQEGSAPLVFDQYHSVVDPNLLVFVKNDAVPPFRFRAGGWELVRSSIKLGPAMQARIAEKGFFMCRVNEDQSGWTELADLPAPPNAPHDW
jgi:hypothetical protein